MMEPVDELIELLKQDKVIPFIGAGISCSSANIPNWKGLILSGLDFGKKRELVSDELNEIIINEINNNNLTVATSILRKVLKGFPYKNWLKEIFDIEPLNTVLLNAIIDLDAPFVLTTNYDKFIEKVDSLSPQSLSHEKYTKAQNLIKNRNQFIFHLHGVFDEPDSVVLSEEDYELLNMNKGYKDFVLSLMKNYHFLFIGCSKDGIMDNDFFTQFSFIKEWLKDSANKHYTLITENDLKKGSHVDLLRECNVEFISYGNNYTLLSDFIEKTNPNKSKRTKKIEQYKEKLTIDINRLANPLSILDNANISYANKEIIYEVLQNYNLQIKDKREKLKFLQSLIGKIINIDELSKHINLWYKHRNNPIELNPTEFISNAIIAYNCLKRIPKDIIADFEYYSQGAILHHGFYSGHLERFVLEVEETRKCGRNWAECYSTDNYLFENMNRIFVSLHGLLSLDPDQFYNELKEATIDKNIPNSFLLTASNKYISIFNPFNKQIFAQLPIENNKNIKSVLLLNDENSCVIANTDTYLFKWNPQEEIFMDIFYSIEKNNSIGKIINCHSNLINTIISNEIVVFENYSKISSIKLNDTYENIINYKDCFIALKRVGSIYSGNILYRIKSDGTRSPILSTNELLSHIETHHGVKYENDFLKLFNFSLKKINNIEHCIFLRARSEFSSFGFIIDIENSKFYSFEFPKEFGICFCFDSLITNDNIYFVFAFLDTGGGEERTLCKHIQLNNDFDVINEIVIKEKKLEHATKDILEIQYLTNSLLILNEEGKKLKLVDLSTKTINDYDFWDSGMKNMKYCTTNN